MFWRCGGSVRGNHDEQTCYQWCVQLLVEGSKVRPPVVGKRGLQEACVVTSDAYLLAARDSRLLMPSTISFSRLTVSSRAICGGTVCTGGGQTFEITAPPCA